MSSECWREGRNGTKLGPEEADLARGDLLLGNDSISRQHLAEFLKTYLKTCQNIRTVMPSGEGNVGERWKTTKGLLSKKATLHVQHTFLCISLPLFCMTTRWNFQKLFYRGKVILFFQQKKSLLRFLSLALHLCRPFSPWVSLASRLLSLFLRLSLDLHFKFMDMTINLSLILSKTRIQKQFPLSVFVFIDSLAASAWQDAGGYKISHQNNLGLHLGCHTCWLGFFTLWCGRTVGLSGVRSREYQIFLDG